MPLRRCTPSGKGTHLIKWLPASHNLLSGCPTQNVSTSCHIFGCDRLRPAQGKCSTRRMSMLILQSCPLRKQLHLVQPAALLQFSSHRETVLKFSFSSVRHRQKPCSQNTFPNRTAHTRVWDLHSAVLVEANKTSTELRPNYGVPIANSVRRPEGTI